MHIAAQRERERVRVSERERDQQQESQMSESFPMNGGDGTYSYTKNSYFQRALSMLGKEMIDETIAEKLDVRSLISNSNYTFRIADLGCSVGPNTFFAMKDVTEAVQKKCHSQGLIASQDVEFQVFFNDRTSNDFNTLFTSLPPDRQYYVAGVPGSFYYRLFPESSIHFVYSCFSLHWLTKTPPELVDPKSSAWNKGRIHYGSASDEVANAYAAQFAKDMEMFLAARAKEMVAGGMMVVIMPGLPDGVHRSHHPLTLLSDYLGSNLMDMVNSGLISEDEVDSFNLATYAPSMKEMTEIVGRNNGWFNIVKMEMTNPSLELVATFNLKSTIMHLRAINEQVLTKHFGRQVVDDLFDRAFRNREQISDQLESSYKNKNQLFFVLKRK